MGFGIPGLSFSGGSKTSQTTTTKYLGFGAGAKGNVGLTGAQATKLLQQFNKGVSSAQKNAQKGTAALIVIGGVVLGLYLWKQKR